MNNNRNNNRRRGRGNNRGGGGGNNNNRIDSRARGNAPQMLEKYKKLAQDASLNDDRVQTEYYLQFADHYFRVIADSKVQKEESRPRRDADREQDQDQDDGDERGERDGEEDRRPQRRTRAPRNNGNGQAQGSEGVEGEETDGDNPFSPEKSPAKPRKAPRKRKAETDQGENDAAGLDPAMLPPAIARASQGDDDASAEDAGASKDSKPARTRRPRKPRDDGDEEALEAVGRATEVPRGRSVATILRRVGC